MGNGRNLHPMNQQAFRTGHGKELAHFVMAVPMDEGDALFLAHPRVSRPPDAVFRAGSHDGDQGGKDVPPSTGEHEDELGVRSSGRPRQCFSPRKTPAQKCRCGCAQEVSSVHHICLIKEKVGIPNQRCNHGGPGLLGITCGLIDCHQEIPDLLDTLL